MRKKKKKRLKRRKKDWKEKKTIENIWKREYLCVHTRLMFLIINICPRGYISRIYYKFLMIINFFFLFQSVSQYFAVCQGSSCLSFFFPSTIRWWWWWLIQYKSFSLSKFSNFHFGYGGGDIYLSKTREFYVKILPYLDGGR